MKETAYDPQVFIAQTDAKFYSQSARKASSEIKDMPALAEVKAVKAVTGVKEIKDKSGKVTTKAVTAVSAVKAVKAREAIKAAPSRDTEIYPKIAAKSEAKLMQIIARMKMEGVLVKPGSEPESNDKGICISFMVPNLPKFRLAFKQSKGEGKNNQKAMELFRADEKVKQQKEAGIRKKAEKEKAEKENAAKGKDSKGKDPKGKDPKGKDPKGKDPKGKDKEPGAWAE